MMENCVNIRLEMCLVKNDEKFSLTNPDFAKSGDHI